MLVLIKETSFDFIGRRKLGLFRLHILQRQPSLLQLGQGNLTLGVGRGQAADPPADDIRTPGMWLRRSPTVRAFAFSN